MREIKNPNLKDSENCILFKKTAKKVCANPIRINNNTNPKTKEET